MKTNVWITHLSLSALLKIFVRYRFKVLDRVVYINNTFFAGIILILLDIFNYKKKHFLKIEGSPIRGPKLNFANVCDKNGQLIITDVWADVMRTRREVANNFFYHNDISTFYLRQSSVPFLRKYFELQIGKDINCAIFFTHYIMWLKTKSENKESNDVLVLTWKDWGRHLEPYVREKGVEVLLVESEYSARLILMSKIISMYFFTTALLLKQYLIAKVYGDSKAAKTGDTDNNIQRKDKFLKIFAPYSMSILPSRRNGLPWLWDADIKKERVLILSSPNQSVPYEECEFAKSRGMTFYNQIPGKDWILSLKGSRRSHGILRNWVPSDRYPVILAQLLKNSLSMLWKAISRFNREALGQFYYLIAAAYRIAYYKDFYLSNNIIVEASSEDSENMFLRAFAMEEIGGIIVSWERSIRFGYSHFLHNKPVHIEFVTGNYSLMHLAEKSNARYHMQSGWIYDFAVKRFKKEAAEIRKSLGITEGCIVIALFDELWGDHMLTKSRVEDFYKKFLLKTIEKPNYRLIIKPKKQTIISEMAAEISSLIREAETLGRCVVLDSLQHVCTASMASDISVALPSMAVFESILSGGRTLTLNYGRIYTELFYQHEGKGKIIFEDMDELIVAVEEFAEGLSPDLGDCSVIMQEIDPFRDGNAGKRIGNYLNWFIEGMDNGMTRDEALNLANSRYISIVNNNVMDKIEIF